MTLKGSAAQRQARLVERQLLGASVPTVDDAALALAALHATDPVTVYLSAWARTRCAVADVDTAVLITTLTVITIAWLVFRRVTRNRGEAVSTAGLAEF